MTICPRRWLLDVSDCQVGTVDVFMPWNCQYCSPKMNAVTLTVSKTSDETRRDKLAETERRGLNSSANNHDTAADEDCLLTTKHVACH